MSTLRLVTWNVRHGLGFDRRISLERVLSVLGPLDADLVALQELDVGRARSRRVDQPAWLADRLAMHVAFAETCGGYGHALLSRPPIRSHEERPLPRLGVSEPRALIDAVIDAGTAGVRVLATHLALIPSERSAQARTIAGELARSHVPTLLLGDLNASPGQPGYDDLVPALCDPLVGVPLKARCTWPALWPFRALDHVLVSPGVQTRDPRIVRSGAARFASDHRPVVADALLA